MKPNHTFPNISSSVYQEIKNFIKLKYKIQILTKTSPGLEESFDILFESIKAHYYTKGKLLFQSSPTNKTYVNLISDIDRKFSLNTLDEIEEYLDTLDIEVYSEIMRQYNKMFAKISMINQYKCDKCGDDFVINFDVIPGFFG